MVIINAILIIIYGVCNWDIWRVTYEIISSLDGYAHSKLFWSLVLIRIDYGYNTWITFPNLSIITLVILAIANLTAMWKIENIKSSGRKVDDK
jgi:hypothetical protein